MVKAKRPSIIYEHHVFFVVSTSRSLDRPEPNENKKGRKEEQGGIKRRTWVRMRERRKRASPAAVVPTRGRLKPVAAREAIAARGAIVESASLGATRRTAVLHSSLWNANPPTHKL